MAAIPKKLAFLALGLRLSLEQMHQIKTHRGEKQKDYDL